MTGFLGYEPERLLGLRRALASALAEAGSLRCDDPLAHDAERRWRRVAERMAPWEARIVSVLACGFDSPYRRVALAVDLPLDYVRPHDRTWTVVHDPMSGPLPALDALARVDELVALLLAAHPDHLTDVVDRRRLLEILDAVLADDEARRRFFAELGVDGVAAVVRALATFVVGAPSEAAVGAREVLAGVAGGLATALRRHEVREDELRQALLDGTDGDPHLAALLLRSGAFPTTVVASWAMAILPRMGSVDPAGLGTLVTEVGQRTGELLLEALTLDPVAGRLVLRAFDDLDLLLHAQLDGDVRGRFLLATADPTRFDAASTVPLVEKVLGYLGEHRHLAASLSSERDLHDWLGDYLGPWLRQLDLVSNSRPWGSCDPSTTVAWVGESVHAAVSLLAWIRRGLQDEMAIALDAPGGPDVAHLRAAMLETGALLQLVVRGRIGAAVDARESYDRLLDVARFLSGQVVGGWAGAAWPRFGPTASPLVELTTEQLVGMGADALDDLGWVDAPPDEAEATRRHEARGEAWSTAAVHEVLVGLHGRLLAAGALAPSEPGPPAPRPGETVHAYQSRIERWASVAPARQPYVGVVAFVAPAVTDGRTISRSEVRACRVSRR